MVHTIAAQPLSDAHSGVTKFEWVLNFAGLRAAHSSEHADPSLTDYLTSEWLLAWNVVDEVMVKEIRAAPGSQ